MRLAVFGATGGTGRELTRQALDRNHEVVVLARNPDAVEQRHPGLRVEQGDVLDPETVDKVVDGADAVLSALGIGYRRHATTVYSVGMANILGSMDRSGVRRLLVVSTSSVQVPPKSHLGEWIVGRLILHQVLRKPYADMMEMERRIRAADCDWSLVRAARLTKGPLTGNYRTAVDTKLRGCWSISRADVAHYMLDQLTAPETHRATIELAY
ncbi:NAD(P)-dependent oxidoreductase [Amycolatopsis nigrescens]|uniref:NAD(P)-dependent oxidoreductase n=1 Tax=Amycolatopsis nigrescens TaxID=381445 RepID=UPI00036D88FD|nr:SDR family oxidoreductase [Amycolatopsis nigrescens]